MGKNVLYLHVQGSVAASVWQKIKEYAGIIPLIFQYFTIVISSYEFVYIPAGPSVWPEHWQIAKTPKYGQAPINIERKKAVLKSDWPEPVFNYDVIRCQTIKNNGHSCQVDVVNSNQDTKEDWSKWLY